MYRKYPSIKVFLYTISISSSLISLGLYFTRKRKNTSLFFILFYLIYSIAADLFINTYLEKNSHLESLGYRTFTVIEYLLFAAFLLGIINSRTKYTYFGVFTILFLIASLIDFYISRKSAFDSLPLGLSAILILSYCVYFLFEQIKNVSSQAIYLNPSFWIVAGLILYFSGTFFIFILSQKYLNDPKFSNAFSYINFTFTTLRNILFSIAFLLKPQKENPTISRN